MFKAKGFFHKLYRVGPGGFHCACCGPAPKHRVKARRVNRKRVERLVKKIENEE